MGQFLLRRLLSAVFVLFIIITASFFVMKAAPGGPFDTDRKLPPEVKANIEAKYHLDQPLFTQYLRQMGSIVLRGDFGPSMKYPDRTVNEILADGFPVSVVLGTQAMFIALLIGLPAGLLAGLKQNRWQDYTAMGTAMVGVSIPNFVLGPLLIWIFAIRLNWVGAAGWKWDEGFVAHLGASLLPSLTLGVYYAAYIARLTRSGMLEVVRQDYIRTARAKGLAEWVVVVRHALKGAIVPVVSFLGPAFAGMLTGSVVIEKIFNIPGLGTHFVNSAFNRDYPLVLGTIVLYSAILIVLNLVVDVLYTLLDPRVSHD